MDTRRWTGYGEDAAGGGGMPREGRLSPGLPPQGSCKHMGKVLRCTMNDQVSTRLRPYSGLQTRPNRPCC
jgi:hypothetical protein